MEKKKQEKYRLLGVDPGTNIMGYAVIEVDGKKLRMVEMGVISMSHLDEHQLKLKRIFLRLKEIIFNHTPKEMAIEAPFFGKNVQSMLKLGRAQGVAIAAAITSGIEVTEYAPRKIKQSVTGNGNASKEQVAAMLITIFNKSVKGKTLDATDALATAVCHYYQSTSRLGGTKKYSGWGDYIKNNPDKAK